MQFWPSLLPSQTQFSQFYPVVFCLHIKEVEGSLRGGTNEIIVQLTLYSLFTARLSTLLWSYLFWFSLFFFISWYDFLNHILWRRARSWENGDGPAVMSHVLTLLVTTRLHFVFLHELFLLLPRPPCTLLFRFLSRSSLQQGLFNNPSAKMSWCIATFLHCYLFAASNRTIKGVVFASFSSLVNVSVINLDCWREIRFVIILKNCSDENYGK